MYLHLGNEVVIPQKDIVAIINTERSSSLDKTLETYRRNGKYDDNACQGMPAKTLIFTTDKVFLSCISTQTLLKRAEQKDLILKEIL